MIPLHHVPSWRVTWTNNRIFRFLTPGKAGPENTAFDLPTMDRGPMSPMPTLPQNCKSFPTLAPIDSPDRATQIHCYEQATENPCWCLLTLVSASKCIKLVRNPQALPAPPHPPSPNLQSCCSKPPRQEQQLSIIWGEGRRGGRRRRRRRRPRRPPKPQDPRARADDPRRAYLLSAQPSSRKIRPPGIEPGTI